MKPGRKPSPSPQRSRRAGGCPEPSAGGLSTVHGYDLPSLTIRFLLAAMFGVFIDIVLACLAGIVLLMGYRPGLGWLAPTLLAVPVVWGVLGIFYFDEMLDLGREIVERFFLFWR
ncbi:MAG: hypothetical protein WAR22_14655 [Desulfomonilia bacterium]|jgi:hypothetical protein